MKRLEYRSVKKSCGGICKSSAKSLAQLFSGPHGETLHLGSDNIQRRSDCFSDNLRLNCWFPVRIWTSDLGRGGNWGREGGGFSMALRHFSSSQLRTGTGEMLQATWASGLHSNIREVNPRQIQWLKKKTNKQHNRFFHNFILSEIEEFDWKINLHSSNRTSIIIYYKF